MICCGFVSDVRHCEFVLRSVLPGQFVRLRVVICWACRHICFSPIFCQYFLPMVEWDTLPGRSCLGPWAPTHALQGKISQARCSRQAVLGLGGTRPVRIVACRSMLVQIETFVLEYIQVSSNMLENVRKAQHIFNIMILQQKMLLLGNVRQCLLDSLRLSRSKSGPKSDH